MLNVIWKSEIGEPNAKTYHYESVEEFLEDYVEDNVIINWLDEIYGEVEIPGLGFVGAGYAAYAIAQQSNNAYDWDWIRSDFIQMETEYVEDTLATEGEMHYYDYILIDPDFKEEE